MVEKGIVDALLAGDVDAVRGLRARFGAPILPGESLHVAAWRTDEGFSFAVTTRGSERVVLRGGLLTATTP
jgi:hypothetical protein